jgi:hypothetical protein
MKGYRYGVNVHETKSQSIQGNTKQWNNAFIVVRHLEVNNDEDYGDEGRVYKDMCREGIIEE